MEKLISLLALPILQAPSYFLSLMADLSVSYAAGPGYGFFYLGFNNPLSFLGTENLAAILVGEVATKSVFMYAPGPFPSLP